MTRTIWLASYPKSGNTWMRFLIANASAPDCEPVSINDFLSSGAGSRDNFEYFVLIDSSLLTHDEIDNLRPRAYAALSQADFEYHVPDAVPVRFLKAHDAYGMNSAGEPLLGRSAGASGAIVIVRDPRDVASSYAHYSNSSVDEIISFMNDGTAMLANGTTRQHRHLRHKISDWSGHVESWLDQKDVPVHLIRYEDLRRDTVDTLRRALEFAGLPVSDEQIDRAVAFSDFSRLQDEEQKIGFVEAPTWKGAQFFRRGEAGSWRDELTPQQVTRIESCHGRMMQRLGYEPSCVSNLARAG